MLMAGSLVACSALKPQNNYSIQIDCPDNGKPFGHNIPEIMEAAFNV